LPDPSKQVEGLLISQAFIFLHLLVDIHSENVLRHQGLNPRHLAMSRTLINELTHMKALTSYYFNHVLFFYIFSIIFNSIKRP
jgi:hypothetical protein